jgi:hypothetical protein
MPGLTLAPGVHFIADDKGALTSGLGLIFDAGNLLGAPRSKVSLPIIFSPSGATDEACSVTCLLPTA